MAEPSFWERLGRGVGYGWKKTLELGSQLSDQVEGRLELEKTEEALEESYCQLGELAAAELIDAGKEAFAPVDDKARALLDRIRDERALVERLREEREAEERRRGEEAARQESNASERAEEKSPP